jgi:hypothetical protein
MLSVIAEILALTYDGTLSALKKGSNLEKHMK